MTTKQRELLSPHFNDDQFGELEKIFELLQSNDFFEVGVQTLKGLNLYDSLLRFFNQYYSEYVEYDCFKTDIELLKYNFFYDYAHFSFGKLKDGEVTTFNGKVLNSCNNEYFEFALPNDNRDVLYPLFNKELMIYPPNHSYMKNLKDISYSLHTTSYNSENDVIEKTFKYEVLWKEGALDYIPINAQYLRVNVEGHDRNNFRTLQLQDYIHLEELVIYGCYIDIEESNFPPNLKRLTIYPTGENHEGWTGLWQCYMLDDIVWYHRAILEQLEVISIRKDLMHRFDKTVELVYDEEYPPQLKCKRIALEYC